MSNKERTEEQENQIQRDLAIIEKGLGNMSLIHMSTKDESNYHMEEPLSKLVVWGGGIEEIKEFDPTADNVDTGVLFAANWMRSYGNSLTSWEGPNQKHLGNGGIFLFMTAGGSIEEKVAYLKKVVGDGDYRPVTVKWESETDREVIRQADVVAESCEDRISRILGQEIRLWEMETKLEKLVKSPRQDLYVRLEIQRASYWLANVGKKVKMDKKILAGEMFHESADQMREWAIKVISIIPADLENPFKDETTEMGFILVNSWNDLRSSRQVKDPVWWQKRDLFFKETGLAVLVHLVDKRQGLEVALFENYSRESLKFFKEDSDAQLCDYQKELDF